jgi:putative membrane protein
VTERPGTPGDPVPPPAGPPAGPLPAGPALGAARRLDARVIAARLLTLAALRNQIGVLVSLLAVLGLRGGLRVAGVVAVLVTIGAISAGRAVVDWLLFSYAVDRDRLVVRRGMIRRSLTVVPLDRIRGVDVHASALQRVLGVAVLRVDAAATGGNRDEAVLDAVSRQEAERLRRRRPCRCWPGCNRGGCCTRRWSAATCSRRWRRSSPLSSSPTNCGSRCRTGSSGRWTDGY